MRRWGRLSGPMRVPRSVVRLLRRCADTSVPPTSPPGAGVPRCVCRVPAIWDSRRGWVHLADRQLCDQPREIPGAPW